MIEREFEYEHDPGKLYESGWRFKWFLDCCHSGSCKDHAEKWLLDKMHCKELTGPSKNVLLIKDGMKGAVWRKNENKSVCKLFYLDRDCLLDIYVVTSCKSNETS